MLLTPRSLGRGATPDCPAGDRGPDPHCWSLPGLRWTWPGLGEAASRGSWAARDCARKPGDSEPSRPSHHPLELAGPALLPPGAWEPHCFEDAKQKRALFWFPALGLTTRGGHLEQGRDRVVPAVPPSARVPACIFYSWPPGHGASCSGARGAFENLTDSFSYCEKSEITFYLWG